MTVDNLFDLPKAASISIPNLRHKVTERIVRNPTKIEAFCCCNRVYDKFEEIHSHYDNQHAPNGIIFGDPYPLSTNEQEELHQKWLQRAIAFSPETDKLLARGPMLIPNLSQPVAIYPTGSQYAPPASNNLDVDAALSLLLQSQTALSDETSIHTSIALHKRTLDAAAFSLGSFLNNDVKRFHEDNGSVVERPSPPPISNRHFTDDVMESIDDLERKLLAILSFEDQGGLENFQTTAPIVQSLPTNKSSGNVEETFSKQPVKTPVPQISPIGKSSLIPALNKPYSCSYTGCAKSYKNSNGLKYHLVHCHLTPEEDSDLRKFACRYQRMDGLACEKRYKNMNGLKYHLEHSHAGVFDVEKELKEVKDIASLARILC